MVAHGSGSGRPAGRAPATGIAVVFAGGGTGGHLYPALALADALAALRPDVRPWFVGATRGLEARVLPARGVPHLLLPVLGLERGALVRNVRVVGALARSVELVAALYRRLHPELVVVTGGYASGPAGLLAALGGVPLALQEQNSVPGLTTRTLSRFARQVHLAFPEAAERLPRPARARVRASGNPIRPPEPLDVAAARRSFGLDPRGTVLLVVGGSQGSLALNRAVLDAVEGVGTGRLTREPDVQLLWATGPLHTGLVTRRLTELDAPAWVRAVPYIDDMPAALAAATLAVSRAGAMATSEFLAWGLPAVLVPLPTAAADHQTANARALEAAGAAVHLPERELSGDALWTAAIERTREPARLEAMAAAARARGRPGAAREIAEALADLLPPPPRWTADVGGFRPSHGEVEG